MPLAARMAHRIGSKVDVDGWLEAFATHPAIGTASPSVPKSVHPLPSPSAHLPINESICELNRYLLAFW
jgi:hypothetical protein